MSLCFPSDVRVLRNGLTLSNSAFDDYLKAIICLVNYASLLKAERRRNSAVAKAMAAAIILISDAL